MELLETRKLRLVLQLHVRHERLLEKLRDELDRLQLPHLRRRCVHREACRRLEVLVFRLVDQRCDETLALMNCHPVAEPFRLLECVGDVHASFEHDPAVSLGLVDVFAECEVAAWLALLVWWLASQDPRDYHL